MRSHASRSSGFTLIELLVVIAIIAILAGVALSAGSSALNAAKRAKASTMATQIQTAVLNYYTEYSVYPVPAPAAPGDVYFTYNDNTDWKPLMRVLAGDVDTTPGATFGNPIASTTLGNLNTRLIPYLTLQIADLDTTNGILKNPFTTATAPSFFFIAIDTDYSNICGDTTPANGNLPDFTNSTSTTWKKLTTGISGSCAIWCNCDQPVTGGGKPNFWVHTY